MSIAAMTNCQLVELASLVRAREPFLAWMRASYPDVIVEVGTQDRLSWTSSSRGSTLAPVSQKRTPGRSRRRGSTRTRRHRRLRPVRHRARDHGSDDDQRGDLGGPTLATRKTRKRNRQLPIVNFGVTSSTKSRCPRNSPPSRSSSSAPSTSSKMPQCDRRSALTKTR